MASFSISTYVMTQFSLCLRLPWKDLTFYLCRKIEVNLWLSVPKKEVWGLHFVSWGCCCAWSNGVQCCCRECNPRLICCRWISNVWNPSAGRHTCTLLSFRCCCSFIQGFIGVCWWPVPWTCSLTCIECPTLPQRPELLALRSTSTFLVVRWHRRSLMVDGSQCAWREFLIIAAPSSQ